jgi:hypothetical protein
MNTPSAESIRSKELNQLNKQEEETLDSDIQKELDRLDQKADKDPAGTLNDIRALPEQVESRRLVKGDDRIVFHVGKELPDKNSDFLMVAGKANKQFPGIYCGEKPDLRYAGGERYQQEVDRIPVYCIPMHGTWVQGESRIGYQTYNTHDTAILMQDLRYFDIDVKAADLAGKVFMKSKQDLTEVMKLRFYYSFQPVYFREPENFWSGNFAESVREGKVTFEDVIPDLMREDGKYEDRMKEEIVRQKLREAIGQELIPNVPSILNDLNTTPSEGKIWIGPQIRQAKQSVSAE